MDESNTVTWMHEVPTRPAVYAMYGGEEPSLHVAYVGVAESLRHRLNQHLVLRDSSIATGTSAVGLRPDRVTEVRWWEHPDFSARVQLEAAELVACQVLEPALRSRGGIRAASKDLASEPTFRSAVESLFR